MGTEVVTVVDLGSWPVYPFVVETWPTRDINRVVFVPGYARNQVFTGGLRPRETYLRGVVGDHFVFTGVLVL